MTRRLSATLLIASLVAAVVVFALQREETEALPAVASLPEYAGSEACRSCHAQEYRVWQSSHHARAERAFEQHADVPEQATKPVRWIGVDPLEQVLVEREGGRLQAFDVAHDPSVGEWFSIFGDEQRQPGEWGHWTGRGMNWNASCAYCHNTAVHKNYQVEQDSYRTTFAELGVGCESCHGPRGAHVKAPAAGKKLPAERWRDVCASCHARRAELTDAFVPGERFDDHFVLEIPDESDLFFADGQVRDEAFELTAFAGSRMAHAGVGCADCHDSHSGALLRPGNELCQSCHGSGLRAAPIIDPAQHGFHRPGSAGGECVGCHMPQTTYMQRHARRDHGFTIPDPRLTIEHGVPNACTRCHSEQPASWALAAMQQRFGNGSARARRAHDRSETVALARKHDPGARPALLDLLREEPVALWRAVAANLLEGYLGDPEVLPALVAAASDADPLVRSHALRTLELAQAPDQRELAAVLQRGLDDPVRSVRVAAAWARRERVAEDSRAGVDLRRYLELAADQPTGQMQLAVYAQARGLTENAVQHLQRAVEWDGRSAPLRHELAVALSRVGRRSDAVRELQAAVRLEPQQPEYTYALGLALNEVGDPTGAIAALERALVLDPSFERARRNLTLLRARLQRQ